jgi:hypothetical protein
MIRSSSRRPVTSLAFIVAWSGVVLQCWLSLKSSHDAGQTLASGLISFFGFFTVLTNILVCLALTVLVRTPIGERFLASPFALGGIATSIAFVALAYHLLLRNVWNPQGAQWVANAILHYVTPAIFVAYWYCYRRHGSLRWGDALLWSLYPLAYFVYVLARGEIIGSYPYGFVDVSRIGYAQTWLNAVGLLVVFTLLGFAFVGLDRLELKLDAARLRRVISRPRDERP